MTATLAAPGAPHGARTVAQPHVQFVGRSATRYLAPFFTAAAVLALCIALIFTIYFTQADLQWTAFLLGVLVAAVLSLVTQNVKVQWRLIRRTAQLKRSKELLAEQVASTERSAVALKAADERFNAVMNAAPAMIFFVDRESRCRYHNTRFETWCRRGGDEIGGAALEHLLERGVYEELDAYGRNALLGRPAQYTTQWQGPDGTSGVSVRLLPYPPEAQTTSGYYVFVTDVPVPPVNREATAGAAAVPAQIEAALPDKSPREFLFDAIEEDRFALLEQPIEALSPGARQSDVREIALSLPQEDHDILGGDSFVGVAEREGLAPAIDRWLVRKLLRSCAALKEADSMWRMPLCCIGLTSATLRDRGFAAHVQAQLGHWSLRGSRLCFEVEQRALAEQEEDVAQLMAQLRPLGCLFSLARFGSDNVSFSPFRNLTFDFLKIDQSITHEILESKSELAKARTIVLACARIGVQTIAQADADEILRAKLGEIGVDYVQGPVSRHAFTRV